MAELILALQADTLMGGESLSSRGIQQVAWMAGELAHTQLDAAFYGPGAAAEQNALQIQARQQAMARAAMSGLADIARPFSPQIFEDVERRVRDVHASALPHLGKNKNLLVLAPELPLLAYIKLLEGGVAKEVLEHRRTPQLRRYAMRGTKPNPQPDVDYPLRRI